MDVTKFDKDKDDKGSGLYLFLFDLKSGQKILELRGVGSWAFSKTYKSVCYLSFAADATMLTTVDADSGAEVAAFSLPALEHGAVFSDDGKRVAVTPHQNAKEIAVWDTTNGSILFSHPGCYQPLFDPTGQRLAVRSDGNKVKILHASTGEHICNLFHNRLGDMVFSPDGKRLLTTKSVARNDNMMEVKLWDTFTGQEVFQDHSYVRQAFFTPDGRRLVLVLRDKVKILDSASEN
jgi:WD40 repeat protein